ncbi:DUF2029 domain-containing protein [Cryobacterium sp. MDB1-18-2]|nr:DUF2029 domain-containing protein [Cryobacterium sp. MDB2-A-1]TFC08885.1 DUF2029 domain-containing protein [Cryobacterium sp. MDB2-A-2]TFC10828.1 DUF2029 domain-containing protein [Cryobacterium sp. MDB2-33-2]TFC19289.1 DUF2029 domain-containing protein [Cryobacterium sp. MDB2-10]TFC24013.1 DUF2029 domain-containing protein [Cryobacterium sp. MDB1-18-2]TFC39328.1 DUF2029 domain-containing protein [Cryobacterium sp. MDB1-18-1]
MGKWNVPDSLPPKPPVRFASGPSLRILLWAGFIAVHAWLVYICFAAIGWPLGDVDVVYLGWATDAASGVALVGITAPFVYPLLAVVPIFAALAFGTASYTATWLGIVTLLNAVAFAALTGRRRGPRALLAAGWWLAFLLLLGPIALARIDSITAPLVILAVLWLRTRPVWGTVILTLATWVKIWPIAVIAALVIASKQRMRAGYAFLATSAVIVVTALSLGSGLRVFSFISEQANRGIQIESPVGAIWMVQAALRIPGSYIYYDHDILTFQVVGPGSFIAVALMTPVLALCIAAVLLIAVRATRAGASFERLFPPLVLALVVTLMAVNKVGSPQFVIWLAAPTILGILLRGRGWRTPTILVTVIAGLTQVVYPYLYDWLLVANPLMVLALSMRNVLEFVVLAWAVREVWTLGSSSAQHGSRHGNGNAAPHDPPAAGLDRPILIPRE